MKNTFKEILSEADDTIEIQVISTKEAIANLKKFGVKAKAVRNDEIQVDIKDKAKVVKWMTSEMGGWELEDIKDVYPKLLESKSLRESRVLSSMDKKIS